MAKVVITAAAIAAAYYTGGALGFAQGSFAAAASGAIASIAVSAIGNKLLGTEGGAIPPDARRQTLRNAAAARRVIYGEILAGGALVYVASSHESAYANLVIAICEGEIESIAPTIWIGDETSDLSKFSGLVQPYFFTGTPTQTAAAALVAEMPGDWNSTRTLAGVAYVYVRLKFDPNAFPGGLPSLSFIVRGRKVFDPRTGAVAWSSNPAICVLDYLRSGSTEWLALHGRPDGFGMAAPDQLIDFDSFAAAANVCDEVVASIDPDNRVDDISGRVRRYTCNGMIDTSATPSGIIEQMQSSCGGRLVFSQGKYRFYAGAFVQPQPLVLTGEMLSADATFRTRPSRADLFNIGAGAYVEPRQKWQSTDYEPQIDSAAIAADGAEITQTTAFPFTTNGATAQRLARIGLTKGRDATTLSLKCNWAALAYRLWDVVTVDLPEINIDRKTFRITEYTFAEGGGINMTLQSDAAESYAWDPATQETLVKQVVAPAFNEDKPDAVTSLSVSGAPKAADYGTVPVLTVTWDDNASGLLKNYEVQFKVSSAPSYTDSALVTKPIFHTLFVTYGVTYDVRVRIINLDGKQSDWNEVLGTLVLNDTTAPGVPTALSVTGTGTHVVHWTTPADTDFSKSQVYANTINSSAGASVIAGGSIAGLTSTAYTASNTPGGTRYYFVSSVDRTGNESALTFAGTST